MSELEPIMPENMPGEIISEEVVTQERSLHQRLGAKAIVGLAGAALLFEQGPLNETVRGNAMFEVIGTTHNALAVGATIAAITTVVEFGSSSLVSLGLHAESGAVQWMKDRVKPKNRESLEEQAEKKARSEKALGKVAAKGADAGLALGIGAALVTLKHHMADPEPTLQKDLKTSAKATAVVASVSGGVAYMVGGGASIVQDTILETPVDFVVDHAQDTKLWAIGLGIGYGTVLGRKAYKAIRRRRAGKSQDTEVIEASLAADNPTEVIEPQVTDVMPTYAFEVDDAPAVTDKVTPAPDPTVRLFEQH